MGSNGTRGHPFTASIEPIERRTKVVQLRSDHLTYEQIGKALGIGKCTAKRDYDAAMADARERSIETTQAHIANELAILSAVRVRLLRILNAEHVTVSDGHVVRHPETGVILPDNGPTIAAARELRANSESIRKLLGLDAPTQIDARFTDATDAAIEQLAAELEILAASRESGTSGPAATPALPAGH